MKKILICFFAVFVIIGNSFSCFAITKSDISTTYAVLPDSVIDKCLEIVDNGNGYLVVKCNNNGYCTTNYTSSSGSIIPVRYDFDYSADNYLVFETTTNVQTNSIVGNYSNISVKLTCNDFNIASYSHVYCYDKIGNLITHSKNEYYKFNSGKFNYTDYDFIATNVGVYNLNGECLFYRSTLPLWQTVKLHYKDIIRSIFSLFPSCLIVLIGFIAIRKAISFIRNIVQRA